MMRAAGAARIRETPRRTLVRLFYGAVVLSVKVSVLP
jgi:hypothetical protein